MSPRRSSLSHNQRLTLMVAVLAIVTTIVVAFISGHDWFPSATPVSMPTFIPTTINTIPPQPNITPWAVSPGEKIFYMRNNNDYLMSLNDLSLTLVIKNPEAYISCASISPDGQRLLITSNIEGHTDIYTINRDGSKLRNITRSVGFDEVCGAWSPDQKKILFYRQYSVSSDIFMIDVDGANETNLTDSYTNPNGMANVISDSPWSPDGTRFVFQSNRDDNFDIYIFDIQRKTVEKIVETPQDDYRPAWSPDGKKIVYTSGIDGYNFDIFVLDLTNAVFPAVGKNLTNNPAHETDPIWSPDGSKIAFTSDRNGNREIYIMDSDGANVQRLTNTSDDEHYPQWIR